MFAAIALAALVTLPGPWHATTNRLHTGISSLAVSPVNGRLWVTFYGGCTPGEDSNNYVTLMTSADGGNSWQTVLVADPDGPGPLRTFDPELWVSPDGMLRWTFTERLCKPAPSPAAYTHPYAGSSGDPATDRLMMVTLNAETPPAASSLPQAREIAAGVMMCKPATLRDGTWLFPVSKWGQAPSACFYASTDAGTNFTFRGGATLPSAVRLFDEHTVTECANGDLLTFIRAKGAVHFYESVSHDAGRTWTPPVPARFAHTSSRLFVRRLASGNLLLVKHGPLHSDAGRSRLTAYLSADDGRSWTSGLLLDERAAISYPDGDQAKDGTIYVTYDHDRMGAQEILFAAFTEDDVKAGRVVSKAARLRGLVVRRYMPQRNDRAATGPRYASPWRGKKVAFLGDSITDAHHIGCTRNYWDFLEDYLGIEKHVYGINGQQWSQVLPQARKLKAEMGDSVDAVFVFMGTNDYNGGVPLGRWWDETPADYELHGHTAHGLRRTPNLDETTVRGRINRALAYLKANFPNQQIVLLTPIHRGWATFGGTNIQPDESYPNERGLYIHDYAAAICEAGPIWSVPVIDLFSESGLFPTMPAYEPSFHHPDRDMLHPSAIGHDRIARTLAARLLALPPDFK